MTKLSDFNSFLNKRQLTPPRPGLTFDEQKHRWVRSGKEIYENKIDIKPKKTDKMKEFENFQAKPRKINPLGTKNIEEVVGKSKIVDSILADSKSYKYLNEDEIKNARPKVKNIIDFVDFYVRLADDADKVSESEVNKFSKEITNKVNDYLNLEKSSWDVRERIRDEFSNISTVLRYGDKSGKIMAIDKFVYISHSIEPTIIPHVYGLYKAGLSIPVHRYLTQIFDYLASNEQKMKKSFIDIRKMNRLEKAPTQDKNLHSIILDDGSIYLKYIGYDMFIDIPEDIELVKNGEIKYIDCILWTKDNTLRLNDLKEFLDNHNQDEVTILVCDRDKKIFDNYEGDKSFLKVKTFKLEHIFEVFGVNIISFILSGDLEDNVSFRIGDGLCYVWKSEKDIDPDVIQYCNNVEAIITNTTNLSLFSGLKNVNKIYTPKDVGEEIIIERNEVVKSIENNILLNIIKQGKQIGVFLDGSYRDISYIFPEIVGYLESVPEDFMLKGLVSNKNIILENIDEKCTTKDFYNKYLSNNDNFILG